MDLTLIAIAAAIVILVVILLGCFVFGTRERTFEDALAEQKGLGILISGGKVAEKHKEKHKDTGGVARKKSAPQQKTTEVAPVTASQQRPQKKEKEGKEKVQRERSTASTGSEGKLESADKPAPTRTTKETTPSALNISESSRSRQSSSGEAIVSSYEENRYKKQQSPAEQHEHGEDQKATAKKNAKKKRRVDADEADVDVSVGQVNEPVEENKPKETEKHLEPVASEPAAESPEDLKKGQKKKQKGKQQQSDEQSQQEIVEKQVNAPVTTAPPAKQQKPAKTKPSTRVSTGDDNNLDVIIEQLKLSPLNHGQLEFVLNALLNREEQWNQRQQKGDQLVTLKKQLEDKEKALAQETQLASSLNQKLKEIRQQYETEKTRHTTSERGYNDQLSGKQRELQSSQQKLQELTTQLNQISAQNRQAQEQLLSYRKMLEQAPNPNQIQQLREENQRLKDHLSRNEQDSHARATEVQRLRQEVLQRDNQLHQAEQRFLHLQQTFETQHTTEFQQQLAAKDVANAQLQQELDNVRREWSLLENSVRELRQQAASAPQQETAAVERNVHLKNSQQVDNDEIDKLKVEINELKSSKEQLNRELKSSKTSASDYEKRLASVDKELKESLASSKRELDNLQNELRQVRSQLDKSENEKSALQKEQTKFESSKLNEIESSKSKLEAEVNRLVSANKADSEKIKQLEKKEADIRHQLESEKNARLAAEAEVAKLKAGRESGLKIVDETPSSNRPSSETKSKAVDVELERLKEDRRNLESKIQNLQQENVRLSEQLASNPINGHSEGVSADALKIQEFSLTHLNKQLIAKDGEISNLKQLLDQQRQKNSELRERNVKVVEAMNELEKTTQKFEGKYQKQWEDQEKHVKSALLKLVPDLRVPGNATLDNVIQEVHRVVTSKPKTAVEEKHVRFSDSGNQNQSKEFEKVKKQNENLQSELHCYKQAIEHTEHALKNLEKNAADHERIWHQRIASLENELAKVQSAHRVDLTSGSSTAPKEIELKLDSLRSTLQAVETEKASFKTELDRLKADVETERSNARDLSSQVVKLRGMLKTGQDALKQEQDLVSQLQKQLKTFQEDSSTTSTDIQDGKGEQGLHDELKELRAKLSQREQQLEREMMINKQLNNKLASLGVVTSPSSGVGNGSV